ncbi:Enoyl-CoA delta isomerase 3 [Glycine max]|nr:Enoyl-CoA delta isomerase 3 [Glycine max]
MCTLKKRGNIFILTLTGEGEHRLNPTLLDSIQSSLHRVPQEATASSALVTTVHDKFFSNAYDIAWAQSSDEVKERMILMDSLLHSVILQSPHAPKADYSRRHRPRLCCKLHPRLRLHPRSFVQRQGIPLHE